MDSDYGTNEEGACCNKDRSQICACCAGGLTHWTEGRKELPGSKAISRKAPICKGHLQPCKLMVIKLNDVRRASTDELVLLIALRFHGFRYIMIRVLNIMRETRFKESRRATPRENTR